ncbi:MAG: 3'(2'),5'-bisphosphate nucleotidase CysQ [Rikenellaceae bacterium]
MVENQHREFLIAHLINAAIKAGAAIMDVYNTPQSLEVSLNDNQKPITAADRAAHNSLKESLGATRIPILSEEGRTMRYAERKNWELFWLIDPLDGTREFIDRNNEFTVNIALMSENRAMFGAIYVPYLHKLYFAERDGGAYVCYDLEPVSDSNISYSEFSIACESLPLVQPPHATFKVAISRSHNTPETYSHIEFLKSQHPNLEVIEQGSSYKFCLLAEGSVDYYVRTSPTSEWDTAAGEIILHEAGGETVTMESGEALRYNKEDLHNPHFVCWGVGSR